MEVRVCTAESQDPHLPSLRLGPSSPLKAGEGFQAALSIYPEQLGGKMAGGQRGQEAEAALRQIGWTRLAATALFLVVALFLCPLRWRVPWSGDAERAPLRMRFERSRSGSSRTTGSSSSPMTTRPLRALQKRSPLDRKLLAEALAALDRMRPRAIGIDILLDQPQAEDPQLLATFKAMNTPTRLGYATPAENEDQIEY